MSVKRKTVRLVRILVSVTVHVRCKYFEVLGNLKTLP